uniref:Uncharacterized protein n=1 Tax=Ditylenchus dipsaci TaxID=166011 RepID=A0A915E2Z4_9BILA
MLRIFVLLSILLVVTLVTAQPQFSTPLYGPQMIMTSSGPVPIGVHLGLLVLSRHPNGANLLSPYSRPGFPQGMQGQGAQPGQLGQFGAGFGGQQPHMGGFGQPMGGFGASYQLPGGMYGQFGPYGGQMQGMQGQGFGHGFQGGYPSGQLGSSNMQPHSPSYGQYGQSGGLHAPYNSYPNNRANYRPDCP